MTIVGGIARLLDGGCILMVVCSLHCIKLICGNAHANIVLIVIYIMSDHNDMPDPEKVDNIVLRFTVKDAVERELSTALVPIRDQLQIIQGIVKQLNADVLAQKLRSEDIEAIVTGNTRLGLKGLVTVVNELQTSMEAKISALEASIVARFSNIDDDFKKLNERFNAADDQRDAIIYQIKGARWAIAAVIALGLLDNSSVIGSWFTSLVKLVP